MKFYTDAVFLIPAYNEEENVGDIIRKCKQFTNNIIVVDDGSTDKTAEIVKKTGSYLITHGKNLGKGEALKTGIKYIKEKFKDFKYIIIIDADMQYDPKDSWKLLEPLMNGNADFVMGYRDWKGKPLRHRIGNLIWNFFFNLLFKANLKDVGCGFIAIGKKTVKSINNICGGYTVEVSMLKQCIINGLNIKQVPINVKYRCKSGFLRGALIFLSVLTFIIIEGIKYRLSEKKY